MSKDTDDEELTIRPEHLGKPSGATTGVKRDSEDETESDD